ncbi:MAG TPA: AarF/ABC1/UbiB kinase family protein, partial [Bacteroidetes bacterium]|nr:AarF/ABC1/UbiB kinase family protein [Bacteroidota bacterium]
ERVEHNQENADFINFDPNRDSIAHKEKEEQDIAIIHDAVRRTNRYLKKQGILNAQEIVDLFERTMARELDFQTEARNLERFKKLFKDNKKIYIPSCYKELSSEQVLIMEYIDAVKITDVQQIKAWGLSVPKILETGMDLYLTMIFEKGIFHADPHPGNVLVRSDGTICLIDFGMVGKLMPKDKYAFAGVFIGLAKQDARYMANSLRKLAIEHEIHDMRQFEYDLDDVIEDFSDQDVSEGSLSDLTIRLQDVMFRYRIKAPGSVFLIFRCFVILEGIGKQLHPNFNTYDAIKPYGAKIIKEQLSPANLYRNLEGRFNEFSSMISSFPNEVKVIMKKARQGKLHFQVEHQGYGYLLKKMDSITNRIVLSIIISSLIVASAITMTMEMGPDLPTYKGLPQISITFLTIAGWISLILAYSVIRRRKYK